MAVPLPRRGGGRRPPGGYPAPGPVPAGDTNTEHCLKVAV